MNKVSQDAPAFHLATIQRPSETIGSDSPVVCSSSVSPYSPPTHYNFPRCDSAYCVIPVLITTVVTARELVAHVSGTADRYPIVWEGDGTILRLASQTFQVVDQHLNSHVADLVLDTWNFYKFARR